MLTADVPRVAVVVLNWNRPEDTAECLTSVRDLAYPNLLPILVDNGSSDGSVDRLREAFPEWLVLANPTNLGFAEGNNVGIRHALSVASDYVLLLNNDAKIHPEALGHLVEAAEADPSIGVCGPKICFWDRPRVIWFAGGKIDSQTIEAVHLGEMEEDDGRYDRVAEVDYVSGCALMARADLLRTVGLLDRDYFLLFEEADLCARAREQGYRVVLVPQALAWHKVSASFEGHMSPSYLYYLQRNRLIYAAKRVRGARRWWTYGRVLRSQLQYLWQLYRRGRPEAAAHRRVIRRAIADFVRGRWGEDGQPCGC